jgi:hypothetical protein
MKMWNKIASRSKPGGGKKKKPELLVRKRFQRWVEIAFFQVSLFCTHPFFSLCYVGKEFSHYQQGNSFGHSGPPYTYILMSAAAIIMERGGRIDGLFLSSWIIPNRFRRKSVSSGGAFPDTFEKLSGKFLLH